MSTTSILFTCPQCKVQGKARPEWAGRRLRCPRCGAESQIGAPEAAAAPNGTEADTVHDFPDPVPVVRWEYRVVRHSSGEPLTLLEEINALGHEGWECVGLIQRKVLLYKRPKK